MCPIPPEIPLDGKRLIIPQTMEVEITEACGAEETNMLMKCPSFQQLYIKEARYGREA